MSTQPDISFVDSNSGIRSRVNFTWRLLATGFSFLLFAIGGVMLISLPTMVVMILPVSAAWRVSFTRRLISRVFQSYINLLAWLGLLTYEIEGLEHLAPSGQLVLANHPSLIDVVFLISMIRSADCVVKHKLVNNPLTMAPVRTARYICNDDPAVAEHCLQSLRQGYSLIIFPEGERSRPGKPLHFVRGAAHIALQAEKDITPVIIECNPPNLLKHDPWYRIPPQRPHWKITVQPPIAIRPFIEANQWQSQRARRLTHHLQQYFTQKLK